MSEASNAPKSRRATIARPAQGPRGSLAVTDATVARLKSPLGKRPGAPEEMVDIHHPRFRGDQYKADDIQRQLSPPEHGNPRWYMSQDMTQIWKVEDGGGAMPMLDVG